MPKNKPADTLRDGAIKATIWRNGSDQGDYYTATISRTYKDDRGNYQDTTSFNGNDLLRVAELSRRSHNRILELRRVASRDPDAGERSRERER